MKPVYTTDDPSEQLVHSQRVDAKHAVERAFLYGNEKVRRVRIEVEFGSGDQVVFELVATPKGP